MLRNITWEWCYRETHHHDQQDSWFYYYNHEAWSYFHLWKKHVFYLASINLKIQNTIWTQQIHKNCLLSACQHNQRYHKSTVGVLSSLLLNSVGKFWTDLLVLKWAYCYIWGYVHADQVGQCNFSLFAYQSWSQCHLELNHTRCSSSWGGYLSTT